MTRIPFVLIAATGLCWQSVWGQSDSPAVPAVPPSNASSAAELPTEIDQWIKALDSNSLSKREAAEESLEALDFKAWDQIPDDLSLSAETRSRLERIRQKVETRFAKEGAQAATVTLSNPKSLALAINAIIAQTGNPIALPEQPAGSIQIDVENLPFWQTMDRLLDHVSLDVAEYPSDDNPGLRLIPRLANRPPRMNAAYPGVFRVEPTTVTARASQLNPQLSSLSIELSISWEPRLQPIRIALPMNSVVMQLDSGESVTPENPEQAPEAITNPGMYQTELGILLPAVPRTAKTIAKLSGKISATLPGRKTTLRIPLAQSEPVQKGAVRLTLDGIRKDGILDEVRFRVKFDNPADSLQSHHSWIFDNEAYVVDRDGKRLDRLGLEVYRQTADEVGIALLFELGEAREGAVFVYETPLAIIASEWPFTLNDIPLP